MSNNPLSQFEIKNIVPLGKIADYPIHFTNSAFFMVLVVALVSALLYFGSRKQALVPGRLQSLSEVFYEFIEGMVVDSMGKAGLRFFPLVFSVFSFVLMSNLLGMFPYFFTVTSHVVITGALAVFVVGLVVVVGVFTHGLSWFKIFVPQGVPIFILPFISVIEMISFFARPVSLGLRLFGNMLAGHIVLKVFTGFVVTLSGLGVVGIVGAVFPLGMAVALTAFELLVAFLQAFVFTILTCIYLNDALDTHH